MIQKFMPSIKKLNPKLVFIFVGLLIIILASVRSFYLFSKISQQKQVKSDLKIALLPSSTPIPPTPTPSIILEQPQQNQTTTIPTISPTSTLSPTPSLNKIYGEYRNGHGDKVSLSGEKITITHLSSSTVYETTTTPEWSFQNLMPGTYRVKVAQIPGYNISLLTYIGTPLGDNGVQKSSDTTDVEVNSERPVGMIIIHIPQSR